jgi:hypothetical protein
VIQVDAVVTMSITIFWDVTPNSLVVVYRRFTETDGSSISANIHQTTWYHIPEDVTTSAGGLNVEQPYLSEANNALC